MSKKDGKNEKSLQKQERAKKKFVAGIRHIPAWIGTNRPSNSQKKTGQKTEATGNVQAMNLKQWGGI